jgi:cytochrome oxidase Cu insertion factor (SCO1/SenC/PrrC family)
MRIRMKHLLSMCTASRFTARSRSAIAPALLRIVFAAGLIGVTACGCDSNTAPIPDAPAQSSNGSSNGSFAANDTADCLPAIALADQHGAKVSLAALKGKPVLIDFIYANCATACPVLTARFAQIAGKLGGDLGTKVTMVSITIDPEHDHPAQLLDYARTHNADRDGWLLLTGQPADIDALLRIYQLKREREPDGTIAHVTTSFLVGADGRQIRMYDTMEVAPDTVVSDIDVALARALPKG